MCIRDSTHTHTHTELHTLTNTPSLTHTHTHTYTFTHTHTHIHTHTRFTHKVHTQSSHTHTHTHTFKQATNSRMQYGRNSLSVHCNINRCLPDPAGATSFSDCSYSSISDSGTAWRMSRISSQAFCKTSQLTTVKAAWRCMVDPSINP